MLEFRQPASTEWCLLWLFGFGMIWPMYHGLTAGNIKIISFCGLIFLALGFSWLISVRKITYTDQTLRIYFRSGFWRTLRVGEISGLSVLPRSKYGWVALVIKVGARKPRSYALLGPEAASFAATLAARFSPVSAAELGNFK